VEAQVGIPILHIAECVGAKMAQDGVKVAALVGTRNVMTESFYRRRLVAYGIDLLPPEMANVDTLDRIIYDELMLGKASREAERSLRSMFTDFEKVGAQAVILANTELEQVVDVSANVIPVYDCTAIHADAASAWMIAEQ
jgi:aspartate racemase